MPDAKGAADSEHFGHRGHSETAAEALTLTVFPSMLTLCPVLQLDKRRAASASRMVGIRMRLTANLSEVLPACSPQGVLPGSDRSEVVIQHDSCASCAS